MKSSILHNREARDLWDCVYECDLDLTKHRLDPLTALQFNSVVPEDSTNSLPGIQEHYPGTGEAIGDVDGFLQEHSNLCEDLWPPFSSAQGFKLAS